MRTLAHAADRTEIVERLHGLRRDAARRWGRMSAHQMVCHVADAYRMGLGTVPVRITAGALDRTLVKWIALWAPLPWPGGLIPTSPELDQLGPGTRPGDFDADVGAIVTLLDAFTAPDADLASRLHPRFGPMSEADWLRWGWLHPDHHLRQFGA